jgi:hypothetical protein
MSIRSFYQGASGEKPYFRFSRFDSLEHHYTDSVLYMGIPVNATLTDTVSFKAFPTARIRLTTWENGVMIHRDTVVNLVEFGVKEVMMDY